MAEAHREPNDGRNRRWTFGSATFDESTLELSVQGRTVTVERKSLEVLRFLLDNAGKVVTKDELLEAVWPGRILSDSVITSCIARLRGALCDDAQEIIRTQHGYGYRLVAPVRLATTAEPSPAVASRAIAVLPFENLGPDADGHLIADGLQDSVITRLAQVRDLPVISRTSVMSYRGRPQRLRDVANELGASHIVEGSLQKIGCRLRVRAQLIHAASDTHLWAGEYDREFADVFAIQSDITRQIVDAINARLTPEEEARIGRIPTRSLEAYELYLRALRTDRQAAFDEARMKAAIADLERALALDPGFAQALALLSGAHMALYVVYADSGSLRAGRFAAEQALEVDPLLPDAHLALGKYLYYGHAQYEAALKALEKARDLAPGHAIASEFMGFVHRRQGRYDAALADWETTFVLDPRNEWAPREYALTLRALHRHADADRAYARMLGFASDPILVHVLRAYNLVEWTGDPRFVARVLERHAAIPGAASLLARARYDLCLWQGRFVEAAEAVLGVAGDEVPLEADEYLPTRKQFLAGLAFWLAGEHARARELLAVAEAAFTEQMAAQAVGTWNHAWTGIVQAMTLALLGKRDAAFAHAEASLRSLPPSHDGLIGPQVMDWAAQFYALAGDRARALDTLQEAFKLPFGARAHLVALNPVYAPLRSDPRLRELIESNLPDPAGIVPDV